LLVDAPRITINPAVSNYTVDVRSFTFIFCRADGVPIPLVQWYTNGAPVIPVSQQVQQFITVPTTHAHVAVYTCKASNTIDSKESSITVIVKGRYVCTY